jgi:hypothetical protein
LVSSHSCVRPLSLGALSALILLRFRLLQSWHYQKQWRIHPDRRMGKFIVVITAIETLMSDRKRFWLKAES